MKLTFNTKWDAISYLQDKIKGKQVELSGLEQRLQNEKTRLLEQARKRHNDSFWNRLFNRQFKQTEDTIISYMYYGTYYSYIFHLSFIAPIEDVEKEIIQLEEKKQHIENSNNVCYYTFEE